MEKKLFKNRALHLYIYKEPATRCKSKTRFHFFIVTNATEKAKTISLIKIHVLVLIKRTIAGMLLGVLSLPLTAGRVQVKRLSPGYIFSSLSGCMWKQWDLGSRSHWAPAVFQTVQPLSVGLPYFENHSGLSLLVHSTKIRESAVQKGGKTYTVILQ